MTPAPAVGFGKIILFGEHAVVYGQPALAAAIDVGIEVVGAEPAEVASYEAPCWNVTTEPDDGTRQGTSLARLLTSLEASGTDIPPVKLSLSVSVPVGAGLGSSAALAVALARGFLAAAGQTPALNTILAAAHASESVFHGNPSGVDHTTSAMGGILRFQRGADPVFRHLSDIDPLPVVVALMEAGADTGAMVAGVSALRARQPRALGATIEQLGALTDHAITALKRGALTDVGELMNIAHGGLVSLGVSTCMLDRGCHAARAAGAWGAKLTGAGGGGCIVALGPPDKLEDIATALTDAGARQVLVTAAGSRRS